MIDEKSLSVFSKRRVDILQEMVTCIHCRNKIIIHIIYKIYIMRRMKSWWLNMTLG